MSVDIVVNDPTVPVDPTPSMGDISPAQVQADIVALDNLLKKFDGFIHGQAGQVVKVFEAFLEWAAGKAWAAELLVDVVNVIKTKQPPTKEELVKVLQDFLSNP